MALWLPYDPQKEITPREQSMLDALIGLAQSMADAGEMTTHGLEGPFTAEYVGQALTAALKDPNSYTASSLWQVCRGYVRERIEQR